MYDFQVYLIHLDTPIAHAKHYLGFTSDLDARMQRHRSGNGAKLLKEANRRGIKYNVVRTWKAGSWVAAAKRLETKLKLRKNSPKLCPICIERRKENVRNSYSKE